MLSTGHIVRSCRDGAESGVDKRVAVHVEVLVTDVWVVSCAVVAVAAAAVAVRMGALFSLLRGFFCPPSLSIRFDDVLSQSRVSQSLFSLDSLTHTRWGKC